MPDKKPRKRRQKAPRREPSPLVVPTPAASDHHPPDGDGRTLAQRGAANPVGLGFGQGKGRMANRIPRGEPSFFLDPFIPRAALTFVVGMPSSGKSTFGAWLAAQADRPVVLPGLEEDVGCATLPRFAAAQVALERCLFLDDRQWSMPYDRQQLTDLLRAHGADLLWVDPIDSYVTECHENEGPSVRAALEAFSKVARDVPCTIVAARHPGKDPTNLCPGSRNWRAVPREIIELRYDEGPPVRRILRLRKDPFSRQPGPRSYRLDGAPGVPKVFALAEVVGASEADTLGLADVVDRWRVDEAAEFLRDLLAEGEVPSTTVYQLAEKERLSERTVRLAARRIGVLIRREGKGLEHRSAWRLDSTPATPAMSEGDTH